MKFDSDGLKKNVGNRDEGKRQRILALPLIRIKYVWAKFTGVSFSWPYIHTYFVNCEVNNLSNSYFRTTFISNTGKMWRMPNIKVFLGDEVTPTMDMWATRVWTLVELLHFLKRKLCYITIFAVSELAPFLVCSNRYHFVVEASG